MEEEDEDAPTLRFGDEAMAPFAADAPPAAAPPEEPPSAGMDDPLLALLEEGPSDPPAVPPPAVPPPVLPPVAESGALKRRAPGDDAPAAAPPAVPPPDEPATAKRRVREDDAPSAAGASSSTAEPSKCRTLAGDGEPSSEEKVAEPPTRKRPAFGRAATMELEEAAAAAEAEAAAEGGASASKAFSATLKSTNAGTAPDIPLGETPVSVGRGEECSVRLADLRASSEQFVVRPRPGGGYELEDRSRNGTTVSKKVVKGEVVELHEHDLVEVLPAAKVGREAAVGFLFQMDAVEGEPPAKKAKVAKAEGSDDALDELFESATCIVCQDVFHKATSVQPCLHSFCSACLSDWLKRPGPSLCPLCCRPVEKVARNHALQSLVDGLVKAHPSKQRAEDETSAMDARDGLEECAHDYEAFKAKFCAPAVPKPAAPVLLGLAAMVPPVPAVPAAAADDASGSHSGSDSEEHSDDSEDGGAAGPHCFRCGAGAWRTLGDAGNWLTRSPHEAQALALAALAGNAFEREVLQEVVRGRDRRGLSVALEAALAEPNPAGQPAVKVRFPGFGGGAPPAAAAGGGTPGMPEGSWRDVQACRGCATAVIHGVVYALRERIAEGDLPARARGRRKCWYGRACRTQSHKPAHAENLDHICEQTRF